MADPTLDYEQNLPGLLSNLDSALKGQTSGNQSVLDNYLGYLNNRQAGTGEVNLPLMAFAAGLGSPTTTGSMGESLSLGLKSTMPYIQQGRQAADTRAGEMARIAMAKNSLATELAQKQLENARIPLTAQGEMAGALGNRANIDYIRQGAAVPTLPGGKPGSGVPGAIVAPPAVPFSNATPPAAPGGVPNVTAGPPMPAPAVPAPGAASAGPIPDVTAGPPMSPTAPDISGGASTDAMAGGDSLGALTAPPAPAPAPAAQAYRPGPVPLGGGITGYRPPANIAGQLDNATRIAQQRAGFRGSSLAAADADKAQAYLDKWREKGFEWDPQNKALVPVGPADPAYLRMSEYAKSQGSNRGKAENETMEVPTGENGLGPRELRRRSDVNDDLEGLNINRMAGQPTPGTIAAPSKFDEEKIKPIIESENHMREAMAVIPETRAGLDAVKNVLTKYETGKWADHKAEIIAGLRAGGISIPDAPADMDPAKFQMMVKGSIDQVFKRVEQIGGRVLASEIIGLGKAVFDPNLQPEANRELVASLSASNNYTDKYIKDYTAWREKNPYSVNVLGFQNEWKKNNPFQDFKNQELTNTVVKGAPPIDKKYFVPPPPEQRQPGLRVNSPVGVVEWQVNGDQAGWVKVKQ